VVAQVLLLVEGMVMQEASPVVLWLAAVQLPLPHSPQLELAAEVLVLARFWPVHRGPLVLMASNPLCILRIDTMRFAYGSIYSS